MFHQGSRPWLGFVAFFAAAVSCAGQLRVTGRVVDENDAPVASARVTASPAGRESEAVRTIAGPSGSFSLDLPAAGDYVLGAAREGYFELRNYAVHVRPGREFTLVLNPVREVFQSVDVNGAPSQVAVDQTAREQRLTGTEVNNIPYPASHSLRNAMKLVPGVVQDPTGALHFQGSAENQVYYDLNGFDIRDPVTNRFHTLLGVEGVRSMVYSSGVYPAEFGKGSAGAMSIRTDTGTDEFHYTATNFLPGIDTQQGVHLGNWTPRFGVSGPLLRGRAWFADNLAVIYDQDIVNGLPKGENFRSGWAVSNLLHNQVNLSPYNLLFCDVLVNFDAHRRAGLAPLDPVSTTSDLDSRQYFFSLKDQWYFPGGILVEGGWAHTGSFDRRTPQGRDLYVISPEGRRGNYFIDSTERAGRDQFLANMFPPSFSLLGKHQIKTGGDFERVQYSADFRRTGYERIGLAGYVLARTVFEGSGAFERPDRTASAYVLDKWQVRPNVVVEAGVREDWDELVGRAAVSPRASLSYSPFGNTRLSAGYAVTRDATSIAMFSRPLDQHAVTTFYDAAGAVTGGPAAALYTAGGGPWKFPLTTNWTAGIDRQFGRNVSAAVNFIRRRGSDGFLDLADSAATAMQPDYAGGVYRLANFRRDAYDAVEVRVRQTLASQYEWMASYTRSRATSNAVMDLNVDQPFQVRNNLGPLPWDAPHRLLGWTYVPLPVKDWALAALLDLRSGFPFSVVDELSQVAGAVNSRRFPTNFDLNLHLERRFTLRGYRLGLRAGFNNITNHRNPTAVNNVIGSPQYLQFLGDEGRHFVLRLRVFGRKGD